MNPTKSVFDLPEDAQPGGLPPKPAKPGPAKANLELLSTGLYLLLGMFVFLVAEAYLRDRLDPDGSGRRGRRADETPNWAPQGVAFVLGAGTVLFLVTRSNQRRSQGKDRRSIRNAERFEWVARAVSDGMWDWDLRANHVWRSEDYARLFGYSLAELNPAIESWVERIAPEDRDRVLTGLRQALRTGCDSWACTYQFRTKDDAWITVSDRARILRDDRGEAVRVVGGLLRDAVPPPIPVKTREQAG